VFRALVLARVVEPVSKLDTIRVLEEIGVSAPGYRTIRRRLPVYATEEWRQRPLVHLHRSMNVPSIKLARMLPRVQLINPLPGQILKR
jgi:hypothetical protein